MTTSPYERLRAAVERARAAHEACFCNKACIERSAWVGCFYCLRRQPASNIVEYVQDDQAALCPHCGIDSVIGDASGYPVGDHTFLREMNEQWFGRTAPFHKGPTLRRLSGASAYEFCDECGHKSADVAVFNVEVAGSCENYDGTHSVCERCLRRALMLFDTTPAASELVAAVALVWSGGNLLTVWNKRYHGRSLPGGKVEEGETPFEGLKRELFEETHLHVRTATLIYRGPHDVKIEAGRGSVVYLYFVDVEGRTPPGRVVPVPEDPAYPCAWQTREAYLAESPFAEFYKKAFADIEARIERKELPPWVLGK